MAQRSKMDRLSLGCIFCFLQSTILVLNNTDVIIVVNEVNAIKFYVEVDGCKCLCKSVSPFS